jgi:hypothetical protein
MAVPKPTESYRFRQQNSRNIEVMYRVLTINYRQRLSYVAIRQEKSKLSKNKRV